MYGDNIIIVWGIECIFVNVDKKNERWEKEKRLMCVYVIIILEKFWFYLF